MKNKTRFMLLLALAIALLLGVLAAVPFAASADGEVTLTVYVVDNSGNQIANYGEITPAGVVENGSALSYTATVGEDITLTVTPKKENYTFVGWMDDLASPYVLDDQLATTITMDGNMAIYVVFKPAEYQIYYVGTNATLENTIPEAVLSKYDTSNLEKHPGYLKIVTPNKHVYGTANSLPVAYTNKLGETQTHDFLGWEAYNAAGDEIELDNGVIKAETNCDVYLVPKWEPNKFPVTRIDCVITDHSIELGRYQGDDVGDDVKANYGSTISGKDFGDVNEYEGYEKFDPSNEENYTSRIVGTDSTANVIYRYYTPRAFEITFDVNAPDGKEIVNKPAPLTVFYKEKTPSITQLQCRGYRFGGYKDADGVLYFNADGTPTTEFAKWTTLNNITLYAQWKKLPIADTPEWTVDYTNEVLKDIAPGDYQITCGGDVQTVTVAEGETLSIAGFLGKEIQVVRLGEDGVTADSDAQTIAFSDRPAAVAFQCTIKKETKQTRELLIEVPGGTEGLYEVAYTTSNQDTPENWTTDLLLKDLEPGVTYTIYLRVRATDSAPHGVVSEPQTFDFAHLVDLKPLFIILLCLFALQILALAFLLLGRRRAALNAVAAPLAALLAVKLIPTGLFPWIILLTLAVVAMQVVLVSLAVQSSIVWKKRPDGKKNSKDEVPESAEFTLFGEKRIESDQASKEDKEDQNN